MLGILMLLFFFSFEDRFKNTIRVSNSLIEIRTDVSPGLVCVQSVCKGYQQTTYKTFFTCKRRPRPNVRLLDPLDTLHERLNENFAHMRYLSKSYDLTKM